MSGQAIHVTDAATVQETLAVPRRHTVVRHTSGWRALGLREIWAFRELLYFLVWRDVKVRYKQTAIGVVWSVLQPLAIMLLFSVIFGHLARLSTGGVPYPIFFYAAYMPWQVFAVGLTQASTSLVANQQLLTKVYFPRVLIPVGAVVAGMVDFLIGLIVLIGFYVYYGTQPRLSLLAVPGLILLSALTAIAIGVWLSALNVRYRDVQYTLPFLTQFWFFATPVAYSAALIPAVWQPFYALNPMVGVVNGYRWAFFGKPANGPTTLAISGTVVIVLLFSGLAYFRRSERTFADVV